MTEEGLNFRPKRDIPILLLIAGMWFFGIYWWSHIWPAIQWFLGRFL